MRICPVTDILEEVPGSYIWFMVMPIWVSTISPASCGM